MLAGASYLDMIHYHVHIDSVSKIVWKTVLAIARRIDNIKLPSTPEEFLSIAKVWSDLQVKRWGTILTGGTFHSLYPTTILLNVSVTLLIISSGALFQPTLVKSLASLFLVMKCFTHLFITKVFPIVPPDIGQYLSILLNRSNPDCDFVSINAILVFQSTSSSIVSSTSIPSNERSEIIESSRIVSSSYCVSLIVYLLLEVVVFTATQM